MKIQDAIAGLDALQRTGIRPGLTRIRRLLARLGNPERGFDSVLITGTNGKGSTAAFLEAILRQAGVVTGLFTSPHLADVRERVRVRGCMLPEQGFADLAMEVLAAMDRGPRRVHATFFEALTVIGFLAFARARVDVAVVEVGMGGRWDSTNVIDPAVSVLTNVSLDHERYLGGTVEAIAAEKVEVGRGGAAFVTGVEDRLFDRVVGPRLAAIGACPARLGRDFSVARRDGVIDWQGRRLGLTGARLSLAGTFQAENAALALAAAEALASRGLGIGEPEMRAGLASTLWPGRFQKVADAPAVILDGCHNPGAAERLRETLLAYPPARPLVVVHGSRPEKAWGRVLATLAPLADLCIETAIPGLCPVEPLVEAARTGGAARVVAVPDLGEAIRTAMAEAGREGTVLVTGSLYLVGAALGSRPWEGHHV